jgi:hypothetical protein
VQGLRKTSDKATEIKCHTFAAGAARYGEVRDCGNVCHNTHICHGTLPRAWHLFDLLPIGRFIDDRFRYLDVTIHVKKTYLRTETPNSDTPHLDSRSDETNQNDGPKSRSHSRSYL